MKELNIIQYLPLSHPRASMRVLKKHDSFGVMTILDIEDSVQDPFNINNTAKLKKDAKINFINYAKDIVWDVSDFEVPIYFRINSIKSNFFNSDIEFIHKLVSYNFPISGIFLPMVESYDQISYTFDLLGNCKKKLLDNKFSFEIIPMFETVRGIKNLEKILSEDEKSQKFSKIHYGHFDYCQDANIWPFPDPDHYFFWQLIKPIIELTQIYNKTYIHTPFPFPNNIDLFWACSRYLLRSYPKCKIWICTLNSELSISEQLNKEYILNLHNLDLSVEYGLKEAKKIVDDFLIGRANKRSFGLSKNRFIPPHQYYSAKQFLKKKSN